MNYYLIFINIVTFLAFGYDKKQATLQKSRIPNATLFFLTIIGGSLGGLIGMYYFHHKTKKWYYRFGIPLILIIQLYLNIFSF